MIDSFGSMYYEVYSYSLNQMQWLDVNEKSISVVFQNKIIDMHVWINHNIK